MDNLYYHRKRVITLPRQFVIFLLFFMKIFFYKKHFL